MKGYLPDDGCIDLDMEISEVVPRSVRSSCAPRYGVRGFTMPCQLPGLSRPPRFDWLFARRSGAKMTPRLRLCEALESVECSSSVCRCSTREIPYYAYTKSGMFKRSRSFSGSVRKCEVQLRKNDDISQSAQVSWSLLRAQWAPARFYA